MATRERCRMKGWSMEDVYKEGWMMEQNEAEEGDEEEVK